MTKLDRKQPYGMIQGDLHGRRYEQNHKFYDESGDEVPDVDESAGSDAKPAAKAVRKPAVKAAAKPSVKAPLKAKTPAEQQLSDQLKG